MSIYHGVSGLLAPHALGDPTSAWLVLGGSLLFEGATMFYAFQTIMKSAKSQGVGFKDYGLFLFIKCFVGLIQLQFRFY